MKIAEASYFPLKSLLVKFRRAVGEDNPYATPPRFDELATAVPSFSAFVRTTSKGQPTIDFHDPAAVRALTAALLERDFQLSIELPEDRLCPIVPGRLEYILWILQLALSTLGPSSSSPPLVGLDIGTGSSCIYPLLGCRSLSSASFVGTEVDEHSLSFALRNVERNRLREFIDLRKVEESDSLFPSGSFDFTMCNPPFYSSAEEVEAGLEAKELEPFAVCTGGVAEMITEGGEVSFVGQMVEESLTSGERIRWFSSLLGKYSSVAQIVALFKKHSVENYTIKELSQGQTKRYVVAWSLQSARLSSADYHPNASSYSNPALAKLLPSSNAHTYFCPPSLRRAEDVQAVLTETLNGLDGVDLSWKDILPLRGVLRATKNSWSRSARRGTGKKGETDLAIDNESSSAQVLPSPDTSVDPLLTATITVKLEGEQVKVEAEWTTGLDQARQDWTTLWAYVIRKLADKAKDISAGDVQRMEEE